MCFIMPLNEGNLNEWGTLVWLFSEEERDIYGIRPPTLGISQQAYSILFYVFFLFKIGPHNGKDCYEKTIITLIPQLIFVIGWF